MIDRVSMLPLAYSMMRLHSPGARRHGRLALFTDQHGGVFYIYVPQVQIPGPAFPSFCTTNAVPGFLNSTVPSIMLR